MRIPMEFELLQALGYTVIERARAAEWKARHPFLETFLVDAEEFWQSDCDGVLRSDAWVDDHPYEALAVRGYLLIRQLGAEYDERRQSLQMARVEKLEQERL